MPPRPDPHPSQSQPLPLPWTLSQAIARVGGTLSGADVGFRGVGIDSRQPLGGHLFVALRGERHDGHDHVAAARAAGAVALMVERPLAIDLPQWRVEDSRLALGRLAAAHRERFAGRVVALTGSNGKTTTKEMIAAILAQAGSVRATKGNLNNDIGLPLTLLEAGEEDFLVLEMGANHAGEIAYLTAIARPEVAAITNAGRAHLEGFGSLAGVARAKGEIVQGLSPGGTFIFPADSPWAGLWRQLAAGRSCLTFAASGAAAGLNISTTPSPVSDPPARPRSGTRSGSASRLDSGPAPLSEVGTDHAPDAHPNCEETAGQTPDQERYSRDIHANAGPHFGPDSGLGADLFVDLSAVRTGWDEAGFRTAFRVAGPELDLDLELALAGGHNVRNALVAVAMARALGLEPALIGAGLATMRPVPGRLFPRRIPGGPRLIDDSYNANPDSVEAAIAVLMSLSGRHVLVLGDLGELGPEAEVLHRRLGVVAREAGVAALYTLGSLSAAAAEGFGAGADRHFTDQAELIGRLRQDLAPDDLVLIKGSRRSAMDRVADALCAPREG